MGDRMTPIPFGNLMEWILEEKKSKGTVFGIRRPYRPQSGQWSIFGRKLETPIGAAAGPHTQLAENIIAAYYAGSRFFELKTVQVLDGEDLPVSKPCIKADDEGYNVEWSTELYVPQAFEEYVKAWVAIHVISKEFDLGSADGFQFNMSVGYDLEGIKSKKIDAFIEGLKDAGQTPIFLECLDWLANHLDRFEKVTMEDIRQISAAICNSATLSTLHGCPPQEIERIAGYLMSEKRLHTFVKCNPTLLGYEYARSVLDKMGYDYIAFGEFHFNDDLQYQDAVPMLKRLAAKAAELGLEFGVKITNTFPVDIRANELPGNEMYMSGKSLFPLSMSVAEKLSKDFGGCLRISYSGGADFFNIEKIVAAGIFPVTMATTLLKPGGYQRLGQMAELWNSGLKGAFKGIDMDAVSTLVRESFTSPHHVKAVKLSPARKTDQRVPLTDCFIAPCQTGCPIDQDIPAYIDLVESGKLKEAFEIIIDKNPLPFITGTICSHRCMSRCTRNFYESPVNIRKLKLKAAEGGFGEYMKAPRKTELKTDKKAAIVGGGPAGLAAAYFLARGGMDATIFEKGKEPGGIVRNVIPDFRISSGAIENDINLVRSMGVRIVTETEIKSVSELKKHYDYIILAVGASEPGILELNQEPVWNAVDFLETVKRKDGKMDIGKTVAVIGGGNTAMDAARAAKRVSGVEEVKLIYRRTKRYMPAEEEEMTFAMQDGIEINELLSPVERKDGQLVCRRLKLSNMDSSGRLGFEETDGLISIEADTVIAAIGEQVPKTFYRDHGIALDNRGFALVDPDTLESSAKGVFVVGDGLSGPGTVVEAIRDARRAADCILGKTKDCTPAKTADSIPATAAAAGHSLKTPDEIIYKRKGILANEDCTLSDCARCLHCSSICENCVDVCPNRANVSISVPGMSHNQIIHLDDLCNECGNCQSFCPYQSAPYLDKLTLFTSERSFIDSSNAGFFRKSSESRECRVRIGDEVLDYQAGGTSERMPVDVGRLITAVIDHYPYLFFNV